MSGVCPWYNSAPAGLCDAAEGWGFTKIPDVFARAHRAFKRHDDGTGRCKVCGGPMDFEAWLDEEEAAE